MLSFSLRRSVPSSTGTLSRPASSSSSSTSLPLILSCRTSTSLFQPHATRLNLSTSSGTQATSTLLSPVISLTHFKNTTVKSSHLVLLPHRNAAAVSTFHGFLRNGSIHHLHSHSRPATTLLFKTGAPLPTQGWSTSRRRLSPRFPPPRPTAGFHTSRPNSMPLPVLPVALFTLKTPVTALVLRMISRASLTLLPLSVKQSPRVILTLVAIPPVCFGLVIFAGLEAAPNTGRWRFLFTSEEEEVAMLQEEVDEFVKTLVLVEDESDPRVRLVKHILGNLLSAAIEADGSTLRTGIVGTLEKGSEQQQQHQQQQQQQQEEAAGAKGIVSTQGSPIVHHRGDQGERGQDEEAADENDPDLKAISFEDRPFQIFVNQDDAVNAFSLGPPRLIFINTGLLEALEMDEDLVAAVVAHELAHVIQRHTMETHGLETIMLFLADLVRSALWTVSIPLGPWFNSWIDNTANEILHFTASGPLQQTVEVEADTVSLTLLALSGYDPLHAVRLWEQWAERDLSEQTKEDTVEVHKWVDWMSDHPPSAERARYLKEAVLPAREMWEKVLLRRRHRPVKRFWTTDMNIRRHMDEDGDFLEGTAEDVMEGLDDILKQKEEEEAEMKRRKKFWGLLDKDVGWKFFWSSSSSSTTPSSTAPVRPAEA